MDIPCLELHVAHGCNLSCESCSHYSNQGHKGMLSTADAAAWMQAWHKRVRPQTVGLLGGEPAINPDLPEIFGIARKYWPHARLKLTTNGFFLHRHPTLPAMLRDDGNATISLSVHHDAPEYMEKVRPVLLLLNGWVRDFGLQVVVQMSHQGWTRRYHGFGDTMMPFTQGQQRKSWEICPAKAAPQLFEGKIWKCAPLAYLKLQAEKYALSESWNPYLRYQPLTPDCSDVQLAQFLGREDESFCSMCPAEPVRFKLPIPVKVRES